jgi:hypothetical protein
VLAPGRVIPSPERLVERQLLTGAEMLAEKALQAAKMTYL